MNTKKLIMTRQVYDQICQTIGKYPVETGGALGSSDGGNTIDRFYFDFSAQTTGNTYSPNTKVLNRVIAMWNAKGIELVGFIHSHPEGSITLSREDCQYGKAIMKAMDVHGRLFMPIVNVNNPPDGKVKIFPYVLKEQVQIHKQPIAIPPHYAAETKNQNAQGLETIGAERFDRIKTLYPLHVLSRKTVVCIGLGGTRGNAEELARCGVGNFFLLDGDTVSPTNIATQQVYLSEIGRSKAEVVKERILDINPSAHVTVVPRFLDDSMTDNEFAAIVGKTLTKSPKDVLICGCTDSFHAQARSAALAIKFGTPYLAGQLYRQGMAAEIYFSYPGVTNSSCPRCAMHSRYEAYRKGYKNDVTSDGTPIFATTRVNATKGQIALMLLLYHEDKKCIYNTMLDQVADRNFVMIRMSPHAESALGIRIFNEALCTESGLNFFDETVWIPQMPNNGENDQPVCSLCGGTGDLLSLKGKIHDTRTDW